MVQWKLLLVMAILSILVLVSFPVEVMSNEVNTTATVSNSAPSVSSVVLNSGSAISLAAGTTTTILGTATVSDNNGCLDIDNVGGTLYRTTVGFSAVDNNRNHYFISCTDNNDCVGISQTFNCSFQLFWYADPTDTGSLYESTNWTLLVKAADYGSLEGNGTDQQELNTLTALSLDSSLIDFDEIPLGGNTSDSSRSAQVLNYGNEGIDLELSGYGSYAGDGNCMDCDTGNVTVGYMEYNNANFTYGAGVDLTSSAVELDMDIDRGSQSSPMPSKYLYLGLGFPASGISGTCDGSVAISAVSDPTLD